MGEKDDKKRQRDGYRRHLKTGSKSTKTKKKSSARKVK